MGSISKQAWIKIYKDLQRAATQVYFFIFLFMRVCQFNMQKRIMETLSLPMYLYLFACLSDRCISDITKIKPMESYRCGPLTN